MMHFQTALLRSHQNCFSTQVYVGTQCRYVYCSYPQTVSCCCSYSLEIHGKIWNMNLCLCPFLSLSFALSRFLGCIFWEKIQRTMDGDWWLYQLSEHVSKKIDWTNQEQFKGRGRGDRAKMISSTQGFQEQEYSTLITWRNDLGPLI